MIKVSGPDLPGITNRMTSILASLDASVMDIGQAVIHETLVLGLLVNISIPLSKEDLHNKLKAELESYELAIEIDGIDEDNYNHWVMAQGKPRYILTLLGRTIEAESIALITQVIAENGLNIDKITRLSGRIGLLEQSDVSLSENTKACVEFSLRGELENKKRFRMSLLELANHLDVDVAVQADDVFRRNRRLVVFDMDSTLINAEVIDELAIEAGVGKQVAEITELAMQGELDFNQSFERRLSLLEGLSENILEKVASRIQLNEGVAELMSTLKFLGYKTAILSGGFTYFAKRLQEQLGFDHIYANELQIIDGTVTGISVAPIVNGERKAELLKELAQREGLALEQVIAIGDGANDLPMLSLAGLGIAFRAKPLVKKNAQQSISTLGLDSVLYLLGISDRERAVNIDIAANN